MFIPIGATFRSPKAKLPALASCRAMEFLLKGNNYYDLPPCSNWFRSAAFNFDNKFFIFNKTGSLNEEANRTEAFPPVRDPC
jgi:hypothetical protein